MGVVDVDEPHAAGHHHRAGRVAGAVGGQRGRAAHRSRGGRRAPAPGRRGTRAGRRSARCAAVETDERSTMSPGCQRGEGDRADEIGRRREGAGRHPARQVDRLDPEVVGDSREPSRTSRRATTTRPVGPRCEPPATAKAASMARATIRPPMTARPDGRGRRRDHPPAVARPVRAAGRRGSRRRRSMLRSASPSPPVADPPRSAVPPGRPADA